MRLVPVAIAFPLLFITGCSTLLCRCGVDPSKYTTQQEVRGSFGKPRSCTSADGQTRETYRLHRKLADSPVPYGMEFVMLLGMKEPANTWTELSKTGRALIFGQDLQFTYDDAGHVVNWSVPDRTANSSVDAASD